MALVLRIYISGRPPVTNLYSSAVFIGWGCVLLRPGRSKLIYPAAAWATSSPRSPALRRCIIAYFLAAGGDTIAVLQAVLDTQFWLATHVVCITLGYAATFVAGLFGVLYVILRRR